MPKPATGNTPARSIRVADETWLPALARAESEGLSITDIVNERLRGYVAEPVEPGRRFTLAIWPEACTWAEAHANAIFALGADLAPVTGPLPVEWLSVAAWLAATRHSSNLEQQNRVLTGHVVGRAVAEPQRAYWRTVHRDSRHLSETVQAILERHLPLSEG